MPLPADIVQIASLQLEQLATKLVAGMYAKLDKYGLNRSQLRQEIGVDAQTYRIEENGAGLEFHFFLPDYYIYVDLGVRGVDSTPMNAGGSPMKFKSRFANRKMVKSIAEWATAKGVNIYADKKERRNTLNIKDKKIKAETINKKRDRLAWAIATSVKKKGIRATLFVKDTATQELFQQTADELGEALGRPVVLSILGKNN